MQEIDFLTDKEIGKLLAVTTNLRHRIMVLLLADAGLRVTEMINLKWSDIDFRTKTISVKSLKKTKDERRQIPMSKRIYDAFEQYIAGNSKTLGEGRKGFIFTSDGGKTTITRQAVNKMLKTIEHENPELSDLHPHKLRHSFATGLRAAGAELEDIRDALGHERLETSLIYAHQDQDKLRELIDGRNRKKKTIFQRWYELLFKPKKSNTISVLEFDLNFTVGRDKEVRLIEQALERNISVVITGSVGVGKTHILNTIKFKKPVLEIDDLKDFKKSLISILLWLFGNDKEQVATMIFTKPDRDAMHNKMTRESMQSLCELLLQVTNKHEYFLRIGDIEDLTPTTSKILELLKHHFTIITTTRQIKLISFFITDFEKVEINPLPRVESLRLFHRLTDQLDFESVEHARNKVYDTAEGNPKMIVELCQRLAKEDVLIPETVNEICDNYIGRQIKEIDMSFILLIIMGGIMALRFIGRETQEADLRMIGGLMMIVMLFTRSFFRISKRRGL
jgi:integrase/recombinase XerD